MNEDELKELFEGYGRVDSAKIILDQFTGRSRGFGFVEMADREEGMRAIEELDSKDYRGRSMKVNEARPRRDSGRRAGGGGGGGRGSRW
jgi:RNA recognition motif-containing protein